MLLADEELEYKAGKVAFEDGQTAKELLHEAHKPFRFVDFIKLAGWMDAAMERALQPRPTKRTS